MAKWDDPKTLPRRILAKVFNRSRDLNPSILPPLRQVETPPVEIDRDRENREREKRYPNPGRSTVSTAYNTGAKFQANRKPQPERIVGGQFSRTTETKARSAPGPVPGKAFAAVAESQGSRIDRKIEDRYKTEQCRAGARAAYDDAAAAYERAFAALHTERDRVFSMIERLTSDRRPAPPEAALHVNQLNADADSLFVHKRQEIMEDLEGALGALDYRDHQLTIEENPLIDASPEVLQQKLIGYKRDVTRLFNEAMARKPGLPEVIIMPDETDTELDPATGEVPDLEMQFLLASMDLDLPEIIEDEGELFDRLGYVHDRNRATPPGPGIDIDP